MSSSDERGLRPQESLDLTEIYKYVPRNLGLKPSADAAYRSKGTPHLVHRRIVRVLTPILAPSSCHFRGFGLQESLDLTEIYKMSHGTLV